MSKFSKNTNIELWQSFFAKVKPLDEKYKNADIPTGCVNTCHFSSTISIIKPNITKLDDVVDKPYKIKVGGVIHYVEDRIDLHNHTIDEAYNALCSFFHNMSKYGKRNLIVITGRGSRTNEDGIKEYFIRWSKHGLFKRFIADIKPIPNTNNAVGSFFVRLRQTR